MKKSDDLNAREIRACGRRREERALTCKQNKAFRTVPIKQYNLITHNIVSNNVICNM